MNIKLENSQVLPANSVENKKSNSGKITGTILGAALSGMHFLELNRDGNFFKSVKKYKKNVKISCNRSGNSYSNPCFVEMTEARC